MGINVSSDFFPPKEDNRLIMDIVIDNIPEKYIYGWNRDIPDIRDKYYKQTIKNNIINDNIDLRYHCPKIYNQKELGSCVANSVIFLFEFNEILHDDKYAFDPSILFVYYNERKKQNTINYDSGSSIRNCIKMINKIGVCDNKLWDYNISEFNKKPPRLCYSESKIYKLIEYYRINQNINDLKSCLNEGYPFIVGISIYQSFEHENFNKTKIIPLPNKNEKLLGGHVISIVGYDDNYGFIMRNSWGSEWGISGYSYIPYNYICDSNLAGDIWTIRRI